ncbi:MULTISPECIES: undecaprenyl-phosphate glucose phosphotransferase [Mesonia]|uniref:UDP-glucose:undecaprenyl-phosphate glucose-1-phosphate transferase n=1 Tax=Mesonia oceanica TaxID=2687242 RepID=A0AC61Y261_9FLAO|nr:MULTISPECIES: undecaprenyl-phosphate glucose phosphotransferase [Mesonia]MAN28511.1 undecaprenyl-phosphate glucose phosphotransferase [Mesonia sp.]MAQ41192.1 undecaprenyl-phosphate glucose phosphotransferase [Mesonia sp.]MBJ97290.1 undecaprenyl-phosphate glucose phosphotransferase [Flavobacteriaceae bacterium]VVU98765.1 UDP-glucose:undecaprenyl-phosphate glucose-1-phosphate transferase [Mesonia oceanica]|tara:strand:- start:5271 stop:6620 length:1350 start_codon:yes stop_codon:yes gene_type:complete
MVIKQGRYSGYLRPMAYLIDLAIILLFALQFQFEIIDYFNYAIFISIGWLILSIKSQFYEIYRFTKVIRIFSLAFLQAGLFILLVFAFFGFFEELSRPASRILVYSVKVLSVILIVKLSIFYLLKRYRKNLGGNYRRTVVIGKTIRTKRLIDFFQTNQEYGYQCKAIFDLKKNDTLENCFEFIIEEKIDEIYCSVTSLTNKEISDLIDFADNNLKVLKFLPDNKEIYTRRMKMEYYGYLPILSLRDIPIEDPLNQFIKRSFDIVLSLLVIIGILSWLSPILAILIKLESKGPVFFRQKRNGLDYKEFYCYKYRSMRINPDANIHQVSRNDKRITNVGKFLRKTSIDELPQFINVLFGDMSIVGPRPHMVSHTHMYAERIDKFMVRHFVKPGITGLAQVSGYRGEVETENDIINRVKYDIFYLENWSLLLDIKIIFQTVFNTLKGEDKAY